MTDKHDYLEEIFGELMAMADEDDKRRIMKRREPKKAPEAKPPETEQKGE